MVEIPSGFAAEAFKDPAYECENPRTAFMEEVRSYGFEERVGHALPPVPELGRIVRIAAPDDKRGKQSGWYWFSEFTDDFKPGALIGVGVFGSWKGHPAKVVWTSKRKDSMSPAEQARLDEQMKAAKIARDMALEASRKEAATLAQQIWNDSPDAPADHPYFAAKGIGPHGTRLNGERIVVPVMDKGEIVSLQFIGKDGGKKFLTGGKTKGCYFRIDGDPAKGVYVCEGFATGATIVRATSGIVYVSFNSGNLDAVTALARAMFTDVTICGDDDHKTRGNPGRTKADAAALKHGCKVAYPKVEGDDTDFNDMARREGLGAIFELLDDLWPIPVSPFGDFNIPALPRGVLPKVVEEFAFSEGETIGVDPAGIAIAALVSCAAMIPDGIMVQPKQHDRNWRESARLWGVLIGSPSTKKSPAISAATKAVKSHYHEQLTRFMRERAEFEEEDDNNEEIDPPQPPKRLYVNDTTIEALQDILARNHDGILCERDELAGWIGSMEKYASGKGAAVDRGFWLQAWNGGPYQIDRVNRGSVYIPNLSACVIGGLQPEVIAKDIRHMHHDGTMQRFLPVVLRKAKVGQDQPIDPKIQIAYGSLISRLSDLEFDIDDFDSVTFSEQAQAIRWAFAEHVAELANLEEIGARFTAWAGKLEGMFARMCLTFHCIEAIASSLYTAEPPRQIEMATATAVDRFFRKFLIPHGLHFFCATMGDGEMLPHAREIAGLILSQRWTRVRRSDLAQNYRPAKAADPNEIERWLETLVGLGWLEPEGGAYGKRIKAWAINPKVYEYYKDRANIERQERKDRREVMLRKFKEMAEK